MPQKPLGYSPSDNPANCDLDALSTMAASASAGGAAALALATTAEADAQTGITNAAAALLYAQRAVVFLSAKQGFGIVGDGTADDTVAFQAALTAAAAAKAVLYCGSLVIKISGAVTMGGPGLLFDTVSHGSGGGPGIKVTGSGYTALTVSGSPQVFAASVYGTGNAGTNGVLFQNPQLARIQHVRVYNLDGFLVKINKSWDCLFETVSCEIGGNATNYAFSMNDDGDTCNQTHILRLQVELAVKQAIEISPNCVACQIDDIHSEQATPDAGLKTWRLGGGRCQFNTARFHSNVPSANATLKLEGAHTLYQNINVEDSIVVEAEAFTATDITIVTPTFNTLRLTTNQTGTVTVVGGVIQNLASAFIRGATPSPQTIFVAHGTQFTAIAMGDCMNPPVPEMVQFHGCSIGAVTSTSTNSAARFVNCVIAEGNNLCVATELMGTSVTCAAAMARGGASILKMVDSVLHGALTYTNASPVRLVASQITGTVATGDAGAHDVLCDSQSTVGAGSTDIAVAPTGGAHAVGDTHWNPLPAALGVPGWRCTTAATPGTWSAMGALA